MGKRFKSLNRKICDVVQDFSLVSFVPFNIQNKKSILRCIQTIDKANGYLYGHLDDQDILNSIAGTGQLDMENDFDNEEEKEETLGDIMHFED